MIVVEESTLLAENEFNINKEVFMKKFYIILVILCITLFPSTNAFAYNCKENYEIISYIEGKYVEHDKKTGNWIIKPNPELNILHMVYDRYGKCLRLGNKSIKYKNNLIVQIGNDYITYLNDKFYTIGGKRVEFDETGFHVTKIGDMSVEEYFTGRNLPESEYREMGSSTIILYLYSDGTIGEVFNGIIIPFE